jgi:hypothetical protein
MGKTCPKCPGPSYFLGLRGAGAAASACSTRRQIARGLLRKHFEQPDDDDGSGPEPSQHDEEAPAQPDLFGGLQRRYPSSRGEYVLLEKMSDADIAWNASRLRKEGSSKTKHAHALEQFGRDRKKATAA